PRRPRSSRTGCCRACGASRYGRCCREWRWPCPSCSSQTPPPRPPLLFWLPRGQWAVHTALSEVGTALAARWLPPLPKLWQGWKRVLFWSASSSVSSHICLSACAEGFQDRILGTTDQLSGSRRPRRNIVPLQPIGRGVSERDDRSGGAAVVRPPRRRAAWRSTVLRSHASGGPVAARDAPTPRRTCPKSEVDHERWHRHFEPHLGGGPSRVSIGRKATADIGAPRSLMKTYRPGSY